ncbi:hypothetical protein AYO21_02774 [Fonsecaea monophora]|uniref:Unplaced genomic scaffold supercont1.1, whole genome shotgun sequence n=2 Tax=Fonsecaea TaxID=40354 RepID=A0A0D2HP93_9EURO|nr:uncharacterized protein Z517_01674 [Fonsecaea pedrosoi CBS 271.37]XP_022514775.1 hypothetical protein AYO21_02774 [Fonsecaea monophora]KIW86279.1 hypothetical protein Z517_01674 [Fonsecaea pedrosoi CBS 271.37]OAG42823.1 hypothetical protein AYO21_02774 [Fonsecaea monophora]
MTAHFDSSHFETEIHDMASEVPYMIDVTQYESLIMFLQRLAHSYADMSHDENLHQGLQDLTTVVNTIATPGSSQPGGAVWSDPLVTSCVHQLRTEGHCLNLFMFLKQVHDDQVYLAFDSQLHTTMNNVAVQLEGISLNESYSVVGGFVSGHS